jgi:hypothetical protein
MEIEDTPLFREAREIFASGQTETSLSWKARVHHGQDDQFYDPLLVTSVNIRRDYTRNYTDEVTCTLLIPLGKYARRIYPDRHKLEVTLYRFVRQEVSGGVLEDDAVVTERYSATLIDVGPSGVEGQGMEGNDEDSLDLLKLVDVHLQLFSKSVEQIHLVAVGGVFRRTTPGQLLLAMLTRESAKVTINAERAVLGVDMLTPSNQERKEQIVITQGTKLVDVPGYLQQRVGIYAAGLGSYLQGTHWYVYPLYDTTQFESRAVTLTVLVLPERKFSDIERTYRKRADSVTVLLTSEVGFKDDSSVHYINEGNGARFADANALLERSTVTIGNKTTMSRGVNNSEFSTDKTGNGFNNAPVPTQRITANPFAQYSALNARNGGVFKGVWQNSDASLLIPGMATRIVYADEGQVVELYGVLLECDHISNKTGDFTSQRFINQSVLSFFVRKDSRLK